MRYIKLVDGNPIFYTIEQLFNDYPDAKIYSTTELPDPKLLKNYDVYPYTTTQMPEGDVVQEGNPMLSGTGEWMQTWTVREFTEEEKKAKPSILPSLNVFANDSQRLERLSICEDCDRYKASTRQCKECGCFMVLKTQIKASKCPLGKWDKLV